MPPIRRIHGPQIEAISHTWIAAAWMRVNFFAPHWRLYHNEQPGATVILGDNQWELTPDVMLAIPPGTPFGSHMTTERISHWYIHFRAGQPYDSARPTIHRWALTDTDRLGWAKVRQAVHDHATEDPAAMMAATLLASHALCRVPAEDLEHRPMEPRIHAAIRRVHEDPSRPIHVAELARETGLSRVAFTRLFRTVTGVTPHKYLLQVKLDLARNLLESTDLSLELVADKTGFSDRFHLTRHFIRQYAAGPATHRRTHRRLRPE